MNTAALSETLATLWSELVYGVPWDGEAYIVNGGDAGLLGSLDKLSSAEASRSSNGGATIAAHADHVRYGISLMNAWSPGTNPWANADWSSSWKISAVSNEQWQRIRDELRSECDRLLLLLKKPLDVERVEANGIVAIIAHLAYHLGAIRQIERSARGPRESD